MTDADKHMPDVEGKQAAMWEHFKELVRDNCYTEYGAIEQQRYEECSVAPGPGNDAIVGAVPNK
jgi:hypothetical protein